nr:MAG TPA: hypothetical protein [Caudoviricetes sp.]
MATTAFARFGGKPRLSKPKGRKQRTTHKGGRIPPSW